MPRSSDSFSRQDSDSAHVVGFGKKTSRVVLLLGPEHSGAALCSKVLNVLGVQSIAERSSDTANEPEPGIAQLHEQILSLFNHEADLPGADLLLPIAWWNDSRVAVFKRKLAKILEPAMASGGSFAIRDPQLARMLPIWLQLAEELNLEPNLVLCLRNPGDLARSLDDDGIDQELSEYRWINQMIELFRNLQHRNLCVIEYETWFNRPEENFKKLIAHLGLRWYQSEADLGLTVADYLAARRTPDAEIGCRYPLVRSVYTLVRSLAEEPASSDRIRSIVDDFVTYQQLQRPLLRGFKRPGDVAAELEREVSRYAGLIDELGTRVDGLTAQLAALHSAADSRQEVERQASENRSHDAMLPAAHEPVEPGEVEREAALAERSIHQFAIERLRHDAAQAKRAAEEATQQLNKARAERVAADGKLARTQQEAALQKAAADRLRQQLDVMRARLGIGHAVQPEAPSSPQRGS